MSRETRAGHSLIERILRHKYVVIEFATSTWAIAESMQNYLRSNALFNMLFDNLSFRYYEVVLDYPRYKVAKKSFTRLKAELIDTLYAAEKKKRLSIVASRKEMAQNIHKYLYMGFDAVDAEHLVLAIDLLHAERFVTRDRDFIDRKDELEKKKITITLPSEMLKELRVWRA